MTARRGRATFALLVAVALGALLAAALGAGPAKRAGPAYPSWADLPPPGAMRGVYGLAPCALGAKVPSALVPVVAFSGAAEEWCARGGLEVVAFDGPGLPVLARGLGVSRGQVVSGTLASRQVWGVLWARPWGWVATLAWGDPEVPGPLRGVLDALGRSEGLAASGAASRVRGQRTTTRS